MNEDRLNIGLRVSINTIIGNVVLSIVKITLGLLSKSTAMTADGMHSVSDVISTIGVIIGLKLSSKEADKDYPYGPEKIESISLLLSIMLFFCCMLYRHIRIKKYSLNTLQFQVLLQCYD